MEIPNTVSVWATMAGLKQDKGFGNIGTGSRIVKQKKLDKFWNISWIYVTSAQIEHGSETSRRERERERERKREKDNERQI